jgi:PEP-CTERM motif
MISRFLPILAALALLPMSAQAANVVANSLASGPGGNPPPRQVTSSLGSDLPTGALVRVGFFNNAAANMAVLTGNDFNAINSLFLPLGEDAGSTADGTTGPIRVNANGDIGGSITNIDNAYMAAGNPLWLWVLNSAATSPTPSEWAIFRDSTWMMPSGIGSINLQTWQIDSAGEVLRGALSGANQIRLQQAIPEPGSLGLAGVALLGLVRRRRR